MENNTKFRRQLIAEERTALKVQAEKPVYWGWFDAVNAYFNIDNTAIVPRVHRKVSMTIPEGQALGIEPERWTAWQFSDGSVEAVSAEVLEAVIGKLEFPQELVCGCFPHLGGTDWFIVRSRDRATANIVRTIDDLSDLTTRALQ